MATEFSIPEVTIADYCRNCPVSLPVTMQPEGIKFCGHGLQVSDCRHEECEHYAPCPHRNKPTVEEIA